MTKLLGYFMVALQLVSISPVAHAADGSGDLYRAFGERAGLVRLMDRFMDGLLADARTGPFFRSAKHEQTKKHLVNQFCELMDGPCEYTGEDMKSSHLKMTITAADFNALVEVLQTAMDGQGIAFADQNRLLALLAPMHRAIVTRRSDG